MAISSFSRINYLFIFWGILEIVFNVSFQIPGTYVVTFLFFIFALLCPKSKMEKTNFIKCLKTTPVIIWVIWVIYSAINWEIKGIPSRSILIRHYLTEYILPLIMMWIVYYEGNRNLKKVSIVILLASIVFCLLGTFEQGGIGKGDDRIGFDEENGLGNSLALNGSCLAFYACFSYVNKYIDRKFLYMILALAFIAILGPSTRKALGGFCIVVFSLFLPYINFKKPKNIILLFFSIFLFYYSYKYIKIHTLVGSRMDDIQEQADIAYLYVHNVPTYLSFLGERLTHYLLGWRLFLENPITGIGLNNFMTVTGFYVRLHTEYMVQLCEGGLIGFSLWASFMYGLFKPTIMAIKKKSREIGFVCLGGLVMMLFLDMTTWTYQFLRYFAIYGLVLAYCKPINKK